MPEPRNSRNQNLFAAALSDDTNGQYIAVVHDGYLELRGEVDVDYPPRRISLHDEIKNNLKFLLWSKPGLSASPSTDRPSRVLCASSTRISVFDAKHEKWTAEIESGEGASFALVDFTPSGNEIICILECTSQLLIFDLTTSEQRIIKTPKFPSPNGYGFRPGSGHLALLVKLEGNDVLSIHEPGTYECLATASVQLVDVQGLKWSPNGAWIACWGASIAGTSVAIYTADGQYFRTYVRAGDDLELGIRTIEWSPDSRLLALGRHGGTVELINGKTFTLAMVLPDPMTAPVNGNIYTECSLGATDREYTIAPDSPVFPYTYNVASGARMLSTLSFNSTGKMIATVDSGLPNILWVWLLQDSSPRLAGALVQKSNIKHVIWSTEHEDVLMVTNDDDIATVHQWVFGHTPKIGLIANATGRKCSAAWVKSNKQGANDSIWFAWQTGYLTGCFADSGKSSEFREIICFEGDG